MIESFTRDFLELVKVGLWGNRNLDIRIDNPTDWDSIYQLAQEQSVQGLVLQGIESFRIQDSGFKIPQMLLLQWIGEVQMIEQQNNEMNAFITDFIEKLRKEGIYTILVKGQGVAQCYEKPLWRCSGDVDLFLSESNYERAKLLLQPMASHVDDEGISAKHLGMTIDGFAVELHGTLHGGLSSKVDGELDKVKNDTFDKGNVRSWKNNGVQVFLLGAENDVFYVFTHFLQHFYKEGLGLRQICDWCRLLWTYKDSLDKELLELRIKRAGLMTEWRVFAAMAVEYLGMPVDAMPFYSDSAKWKKKAEKILDFVLEVGNFGHNRDSNYMKYPYVIRKCFSMGRRIGDSFRHARIFPLDSLRFFPYMMFNGVRSAIRGE